MNIYIYGNRSKRIVTETESLCLKLGFEICTDINKIDLGLAPWLVTKIPDEEINQFKHGVLIFHPSLLPMHGGPQALRAAFKAGAYYSGITWFWANGQFDRGDICEQSAVRIDPGETPREYYENKCIPEAMRLLEFALIDVSNGHIRKRPQVQEYGSYEPAGSRKVVSM